MAADDVSGAATETGPLIGAPSKRGGISVLRKSPRLASKPGSHVLVQAMARKAALRDGLPKEVLGLWGRADPEQSGVGSALVTAGRGGGGLLSPSVNRRITDLSASCRVLLSEDEVCRFASFLRSAEAEV